MLRWRNVIDRGLTLAGIVVVLVPALMFADSSLQVGIVVLGILMVEAGVWGLARELSPDARVYTRLRDEVDAFVASVRNLNDRAVADDEAAVEELRGELHARVDRIVAAAGVEVGERSEDAGHGAARPGEAGTGRETSGAEAP